MKKWFLILGTFALMLNFAFAGYYIEQKVTTSQRGQTRESLQKTWIEGPYTRVDTGKAIIIVDFKNQKAILADTSKKTYFEMNFQQMNQMMNMAFQMMKQMGMDITPKVEVTNQTKVINGHKCVMVNISMGNFQKTEECFTKDIKLDFSAYMKAVEILFPKDLAEAMKAHSANLAKLGYPIYAKTVTSVMGQSSTTETILVSYKEMKIPAGIFAPPEGFKKTEAPQMRMPQGR